jgi:hypothetical protein
MSGQPIPPGWRPKRPGDIPRHLAAAANRGREQRARAQAAAAANGGSLPPELQRMLDGEPETRAERGLRELRQKVDQFDRRRQEEFERHRGERERAQRLYEETRCAHPEVCRTQVAAGGSWLFDPPGQSRVF